MDALVHEKDTDGRTPLHYAARWGDMEVVQVRTYVSLPPSLPPFLLKHSLSQFSTAHTPLPPPLPQTLIARGAEVRAGDIHGHTPADEAEYWGHAVVKDYLRGREGGREGRREGGEGGRDSYYVDAVALSRFAQ